MADEIKEKSPKPPKEQPDKGASSFRTNIFKTVKGISEKFGFLVGASTDNLKEVRKQTRDLSLQVRLTKKQIKENRFRLDKIAESNLAVAGALQNYDKINFAAIEQVEQLLAQNKEIPAELGKQYKEAIEMLSASLKPLEKQEGFMVNLGSTMDEVAKIIADRSIAPDTRKSYVTDFIKLLEKNKEQFSPEMKQLYDLLLDEARSGLKMQDSQTDNIGAIFELMKTNRIDEIKMQSTLGDINHTAGKLLMSSRNIEDKINQNQISIKDLLDRLEKGIGEEGLSITDLILAALGVPGLLKTVGSMWNFGKRLIQGVKDIFGEKGFISEMVDKLKDGFKYIKGKGNAIAKVFGKGGFIGKIIGRVGNFAKMIGGVFKTIGGFFGTIGKFFAPLLRVLGTAGKVGAAFLGPVAVVIGAIMGIFDAVSGFFNADQISGKSEEMLTMGDKIQAAISGFISGLTLGFVSAETIFKKIDEAQTFIGELWDTTGQVFDDFITAITEFFTSDDGFMGTIKKIAEKFTNFKVASIMPDWVADAVGLGEENEEVEPVESGRFSNAPTTTRPVIGSMAAAKMKFDSQDKMQSDQLLQSFKKEESVKNQQRGRAVAQAITVPSGGGQKEAPRPAIRKGNVDDTQLAVLNLGLMD